MTGQNNGHYVALSDRIWTIAHELVRRQPAPRRFLRTGFQVIAVHLTDCHYRIVSIGI